jgi:hypothetical protein
MNGGNNIARAAFGSAAGVDGSGLNSHDRLDYTDFGPIVLAAGLAADLPRWAQSKEDGPRINANGRESKKYLDSCSFAKIRGGQRWDGVQ